MDSIDSQVTTKITHVLKSIVVLLAHYQSCGMFWWWLYNWRAIMLMSSIELNGINFNWFANHNRVFNVNPLSGERLGLKYIYMGFYLYTFTYNNNGILFIQFI